VSNKVHLMKIVVPAAIVAVLALHAGCDKPLNLLGKKTTTTNQPQDANIKDFDQAVADAAALRYDSAAKQFAKLISVFEEAQDVEHASDSMFWLAFCYEKTNRKEQAVIFYEHLQKKYPDTKAAGFAARRHEAVDLRGPMAATSR